MSFQNLVSIACAVACVSACNMPESASSSLALIGCNDGGCADGGTAEVRRAQCVASDVTAPSGICSGPWRYEYFYGGAPPAADLNCNGYRDRFDGASETEVLDTRVECAWRYPETSWDYGCSRASGTCATVATTFTYPSSTVCGTVCERDCDEDGHCRPGLICYDECTTECGPAADYARALVPAAYSSYVRSITAGIPSGGQCHASARIPYAATFERCGACAHAGNGTYAGFSHEGHSAPTLGRASPSSPVCTTGDELASPGARIDRMAATTYGAWEVQQVYVAPRARVLLELYGDRMTPAQRASAREYFAAPYLSSALACEAVTPSVALPASCPSARAREIARDLAYCDRLSYARYEPADQARFVRPSVAWVDAGFCLDLFDRLESARASSDPDHACSTTDLRSTSRDLAQRVVRAAMGALAERDGLGGPDDVSLAQYPDLDRTLLLVDRWYTGYRASLVAAGVTTIEDDSYRALGDMLAAFWESAQRGRRAVADVEELASRDEIADSELTSALARTALRADRLDRDILRAAYRPSGTAIAAVRSDGADVLPATVVSGSIARGDVLLMTTMHSLEGLTRGLSRIEPYHDLGCRLGACGPGTSAPRTRTANLWRAISLLDRDEPETLSTALARMPAGDEWRVALAAVAANRGALIAAIDAATAETDSVPIDEADVTGLRPPGRDLSALARAAAERRRAFDAAGTLGLPAERRIHANVSEEGRAAAIASLEVAHTALEADIARFRTDRVDAVRDALEQDAALRGLAAAEQRLAELERERQLLESDSAGLTATLARADRVRGEVADRIVDAAGAVDSGSYFAVGDTRRFEIRGHDASRAINARRLPDVSHAAARDIERGVAGIPVVQVDANRLVVLEAAGEYAALCSLTRADEFAAELPDLADASIPGLDAEPPPGTTIGPEGFVVVREGSTANVESRDQDTVDHPLVRTGVALLGLIPKVGPALAAAGSIALDLFDPTENSVQSSTSDAVRFEGGLRLPETPFPTRPAGALLVIELPRGVTDPSQIRAIHLVSRPSSTFIVDADVDLYFVVNDHWVPTDPDCAALSPAGDPHAVTVSLRVAAPTDAVATTTLQALGATLDEVRERRAELLVQGRVLPSQLASVRQDAIVRFQDESHYSLAQNFPPVLGDLVQAYIEREVSTIDVAVERQALERRVEQVLFEVDGIQRDLVAVRRGAKVVTLLPAFRLRSFDELTDGSDERALVQSAERLSGEIEEGVLPILELWRPDALVEVRGNVAVMTAAQRLAAAGPSTDPLALVDDVELIVGALIDAYRRGTYANFGVSPDQPIIAVSFPRPEAWIPDVGSTESDAGLPEASPERSFAVWNAIEAALRRDEAVPYAECISDSDCVDLPGTRCDATRPTPICVRASTQVELGIETADVYRRLGGTATLSCHLAVPVIREVALFFTSAFDDGDEDFLTLSTSGRRLTAHVDATQSFATESALADLSITEPTWLNTDVSLVYGEDESAHSRFDSLVREGALRGRRPVGLSAFSRWTYDFAPLATMRHSYGNGIGETSDRATTALVVFMHVDARGFASSPLGRELDGIVSTCTAPPAGALPIPPLPSTPPAGDPPAEDPPADDPPTDEPPTDEPPTEPPPAEEAPGEPPPADEPPSEPPRTPGESDPICPTCGGEGAAE